MVDPAMVTGAALGALGTLLANVQKARASAPPEGVDPAVWDMMLNTVEATAVQQGQIEQLTQSVNQLVIAMGGTPATAEDDPFANTDKFTTGQLVCTVAGLGFQLDSIPIPKNKQLIVKAHPNNTGWIYLAQQQAQSQRLVIAYILLPNEGVGLFLKNADAVWVQAPVVNDGVVFMVEQE